MPHPKSLPQRPDLDHLRGQARALHKALRAGEADAAARLAAHHPRPPAADAVKLADAQLTVAREYGEPSWPRLKQRVEALRATRAERAERLVRLATEPGAGSRTGPAARALERLLADDPSLTQADLLTRLVSGDAAALRAALADDPAFATTPTGPRGWQPLLYVAFSVLHERSPAIADGLLSCARLLLDAGADPDVAFVVEPWPDSPLRALYGACGVTNFPEMAALLLDRGATIDDFESLYHSNEHPDTRVLELLLARGADPAGTNALNRSLDFRGLERAALLLAHGADPNEHFADVGTPLHVALGKGRELAMLELLVEHGADLDARRPDGRTPYQVALQHGQLEAAEWLAARGADTTSAPLDELIAACAAGDEAAARAVVAAHPGLLGSLSNQDGRALIRLAELGQAGTIRGLLAAGFPVDAPGHEGQTALHQAAWHGQLEAARALVEGGAGLEVVEGEFGSTPLIWAVHGAHFGPDRAQREVAALLLEAGADPDVTNAWDNSALDLAADDAALADLLRRHGATRQADVP